MVLPSDDDAGTLDALQFSLASDIVELVVLTRDEAFLHTLREAVGERKRLWHVLSAEKVGDLLVAGQVGIVLLDVGALHDPAHAFIAQIKRQFPDLVVVVAGSRHSEIELAGLISAGVVYRFIHKPMSPGRARLFAEAAARKYGEQRVRAAAAPMGRAPQRNYLLLGAAAFVALSVVAAVFWALHNEPSQVAATYASASAVKATSARAALLARAASALAANRLTAPAGENALELYLQASAQSPADALARAGLADVRDRLLARAENALLEERLDEAAAAIETARQAGVESGRIAFLSAQLAKLEDQVKAARSRTAAKPSPVPAVDDRVAALVGLALQRSAAGQLIEPDRDNARYYLEAALSINPQDGAALDAKRALALQLLSAARASIDRRDFTSAAQWLQGADGIASSSDTETLQALLLGSRQQAQADAMAQTLKDAEQARAVELSSADNGGVQSEPQSAAAKDRLLGDIVPASQLTLVKSVPPIYPARAQARREEGWVELDFTVAEDGAVKAVVLHAASNPGVFDNAAIKAVSQWRYRAVTRDDAPTAVRARVRIRFAAP